MGVRRAAKGVGDFLVEMVGEFVLEAVLVLLACVLLGCLVLLAHLSWSFSPSLTVAGTGLLCLFLAHGARQVRTPAKGRRRGLAALAAAGFTLTAVTALFLLLYATGCDCL
ncbi:lysine transporter LysE [Streptomyces sp. NPDC102402]|uniref:lysine transporter LysE n=1 Tax=Streptomyces sp. NPDC102402 TaxID=3366169 RepID=UPI003805444D